MASQASVTVSIQFTPPSAPVGSGTAVFQVTANHNAQNVGQIDVNPADPPATVFPLPFGSVAKAKILVVKNLMSSEIGVRINGSTALFVRGTTASITTFSSPTLTLTGLTGMTAAMVGGTILIAGAASPGNNGTFTILSWISASSVTVSNAGGVASDANSGQLFWAVEAPGAGDVFQLAAGGEFCYVCSAFPAATPVTGVSVVTTASPAAVELIQYWVFGD